MTWLQKTVRTLNPTIDLEGSPWAEEWEETQRSQFLRAIKVILPIIGIIYLLHYPLFDKPNNLTPLENWLQFRLSAASLAFIAALTYFTPIASTKWYKIPAIVVAGLMCYSQAFVTFYYPAAPWLYPFLFLIGASLLLKLDIVKSLVLACLSIATFFNVLQASGIDQDTLISASTVTLMSIGMLRSTYSFEVSNFLLNKQNAAQQEQNLELQREFSDRIKSFIPAVIARRIQFQVDKNQLSVSEASINVLQPRKLEVSCLFSDIRGFTQGSKQLDSFISESVLPEVKAASTKIEEYGGIPRKIGDLIFAYYDDENVQQNAVRAVQSGIELSRLNKAMNQTLSTVEINRYILISTGPAIVGNLGGIDSSVEITALGSPVNFLSRLDDSTKDPSLAQELSPGDIVVCERTAQIFSELGLGNYVKELRLDRMGIQIRDFPETRKIYVANQTNNLDVALERISPAYS